MRRSKTFFDMKKVKDKTEQCCKKAYICFSKQIIKHICFQNNSFLWKLCLIFMQIAYKQFSAQIK